MRRNILLIAGIIVAIILGINSVRKIMTFRGTFEKVEEAEQKLERLKVENEKLKRELEYKKSDEFIEGEIRNKLGLVKEGEVIVIVPKEVEDQGKFSFAEASEDKPNWQKWRELFFGT